MLCNIFVEIEKHPDLKTNIWINDQCFNIENTLSIQLDHDENIAHKYLFRLVLDNKQNIINACHKHNPDIVYAHVKINKILFDNNDVSYLIKKDATYSHYLNGQSSIKIIEPFTDHMGCDGELQFNFELPLFRWYIMNFSYSSS